MTPVLTFYDTPHRARVPFTPRDPAHVRMYVCGPTVYDDIHIGNARPLVVFDVLYRLLRWLFPRVTYARNITDVDDKINARARAGGESIRSLTERTVAGFRDDTQALECLPPDHEPRATDHIADMQTLILRLIDRGHAYGAAGHVLFDVASWPPYGVFAAQDQEALEVGARIETAPYKKSPGDFVLWKPSSPELPGWDSPWGRGRPGWHIECSAMSARCLGVDFDIHGGGQDLIFPHHQNEVAQSLCAHPGSHFAATWVHNGYVTVDGEKMSKSRGNFHTVRDLLRRFPGEALRLTILKTHYRQPLDFSVEKCHQARADLDRFYLGLRRTAALPAVTPSLEECAALAAPLCEDMNVPEALATLHRQLAILNRTSNDAEAAAARGRLSFLGSLLGILQRDPEQWLQGEAATPENAAIEAMIARRRAAKQARDFAAADALRAQLRVLGVVLEDGPDGRTTWRRE